VQNPGKMVTITCAYCGGAHEIRKGEFVRKTKMGKTQFYCSLTCSATAMNERLGKKSQPIERTCPTCGKQFISSTKAKGAKFCSRGCASAGSVTEYRRARAREVASYNPAWRANIGRPENVVAILKRREAHKYRLLEEALSAAGIIHEFEFLVAPYVFDLAMPGRRVLVEFDGKYHEWGEQMEVDTEKQRLAASLGWAVVRIRTDQAVFAPELLANVGLIAAGQSLR
jgi:very-short-patch-repair endonuclease